MDIEQARQALAFEPPAKQAAGDYALAEKECFKASARLVQKVRDVNREKREAEARSQRLWDEKEALAGRLNKYLVRNLIPVVDSCKHALGPRPGALAALRDASLPVDAPLLAAEPRLADDVVFGIRGSGYLGDRFADQVLDAWTSGRSSLLQPLPDTLVGSIR
jgi:hypothetical protein